MNSHIIEEKIRHLPSVPIPKDLHNHILQQVKNTAQKHVAFRLYVSASVFFALAVFFISFLWMFSLKVIEKILWQALHDVSDIPFNVPAVVSASLLFLVTVFCCLTLLYRVYTLAPLIKDETHTRL